MTNEQFENYARRIAPVRERYLERQFELEAACANAVAAYGARAAHGIRTSGRYWALGAVLAQMSAQPYIEVEIRALDAALAALDQEYAQTSARIESEVLSDDSAS